MSIGAAGGHLAATRRRSRPSKWAKILSALGGSLLLSLAACATGSIELAEIGSYYVAGSETQLSSAQAQTGSASTGPAAAGGPVEIGQIYVQFARLAHPTGRYPVLLIPGGSLSGVSYETTPDGRPGWQSDFLRGGYSVLIADTGYVGRSPAPLYPDLIASPSFRAKRFLWEVFRIGPENSYAQHIPYPGSRFPESSFDVLAQQTFPRFRPSAEVERERYNALIAEACPCILVAHSAAAPPVVRAAADRPELIRALILVEPSRMDAYDDDDRIARVRQIPHLFLWGDNLERSDWAALRSASRENFDALTRAGAHASFVDLPERGVRGNSHLLMMDDNSHEIASMMISWLAQQSLSVTP